MDDKKKRKYVVPEAEIIDFAEEDIITLSAGNAETGNWWDGDGDNTEGF